MKLEDSQPLRSESCLSAVCTINSMVIWIATTPWTNYIASKRVPVFVVLYLNSTANEKKTKIWIQCSFCCGIDNMIPFIYLSFKQFTSKHSPNKLSLHSSFDINRCQSDLLNGFICVENRHFTLHNDEITSNIFFFWF